VKVRDNFDPADEFTAWASLRKREGVLTPVYTSPDVWEEMQQPLIDFGKFITGLNEEFAGFPGVHPQLGYALDVRFNAWAGIHAGADIIALSTASYFWLRKLYEALAANNFFVFIMSASKPPYVPGAA